MRVMVTGGTGFAGSHTVREFVRRGHSVRLLVRDASKVRRIFDAHDIGIPEQDVIVGDIGDPEAANRAMEGCDAVYHGAALVSMKRSMASQLLETNARGVENVVGGAHRRGLPSIVYTSSISIFFTPNSPPLSLEQPIAAGTTAYAQSKAEAERTVRRLQDEGAPIRVTYPTGILGPDDPGLSEANNALYIFLRLTGVITSNGFQLVDVRDLAQLHGHLLEVPEGPRRYVAAGPYLQWPDVYKEIDEVTGKWTLRFPCPAPLMHLGGIAGDFVKRFWDFEFPLTRDAMEYACQWPGTAPTNTSVETGVEFRPASDTFRDTIRWMYEAGHLNRRQVGRLAELPAAAAEAIGPDSP